MSVSHSRRQGTDSPRPATRVEGDSMAKRRADSKAGPTAKAGTAEALERLLEEGIQPLTNGIANLAGKGLIPIIVFEPGKAAKAALRVFFPRWKPAVRLIGVTRENFAQTLGRSDHVTAEWGSRARPKGDIPIFVFAQEGTLLMNFMAGEGYSIEAGSLDHALVPEHSS